MSLLNYSVSLVPGTNEDVTDVQAMFDEVRAVVNELDNSNIAADAAIDVSKLNLPASSIPVRANEVTVQAVSTTTAPSAITPVTSGVFLIMFSGYANQLDAVTTPVYSGRARISVAGGEIWSQEFMGYYEEGSGTFDTGRVMYCVNTIAAVSAGQEIMGDAVVIGCSSDGNAMTVCCIGSL